MGIVDTVFYLYKAGMTSMIAYYFFMNQTLGELAFTLLVIDILVSIILFGLLRRAGKALPKASSSLG